jgi:hypothetical protein
MSHTRSHKHKLGHCLMVWLAGVIPLVHVHHALCPPCHCHHLLLIASGLHKDKHSRVSEGMSRMRVK